MTATLGPCISADSHVTEPPGTYLDRIDPAYRDRAPRLHHHDALGDVMLIDNGKSLVPFWLVAAAGRPSEEVRLDSGKRFEELWRGGWDPVARLADQDTDGVVAEVIYPSVGMLLCNHPDAEYQRACFHAYNQWIVEFCATAPERLIGMGQTALVTPKDGIRDLEEIKRLGLKGVMLPGIPPENDYDHPMYDELWAMGLSVGKHPTEFVRTELRAQGVVTAADLRDLADRSVVEVAGVVTHRQQPSTAKGTVFLNLEDETGLVNVICAKGTWKRFRTVARGAPALRVRGVLEKHQGVTNLVAGRITRLPISLAGGLRSRDFH